VLIAQVAGLLKSPIQRMAGVLAPWPRSVAAVAKPQPRRSRLTPLNPFSF
jgi:hypothetical protein